MFRLHPMIIYGWNDSMSRSKCNIGTFFFCMTANCFVQRDVYTPDAESCLIAESFPSCKNDVSKSKLNSYQINDCVNLKWKQCELLDHFRSINFCLRNKNSAMLTRNSKTPVLRIDNQQNFKIMKILILLKSFISLFHIIRYILGSMM